MSRRPAKFTQAALTRALKAAEAAGVKMAVEICQDGTARLVPIEAKSATVLREVIL